MDMPMFAFIDEDGHMMMDDDTGRILIYHAVDKPSAMIAADQDYEGLYRCVEVRVITDEEI